MDLENNKELRTGAVIVAAGHKSRNTPFNPLLPVGDSTVIRRIIITLKRGGVSPIVVITGDKADEIEKHISNLQVICLRNEQYDKVQMFSSICMGLNYIEDLCDRVFVLPAKFPVFLKETVQQMMKSDADIVRPVFDGYRGHPVLVSLGCCVPLFLFREKMDFGGPCARQQKALKKRIFLLKTRGSSGLLKQKVTAVLIL